MDNENINQKVTLLIVEDDKAIRESLQDILELTGYDVITAINGRKGLVAVLKDKPTLVICDVNMPLMGGFELLRSLSECMEKELVPPFLFLTARATLADIRKGMELGADDYITKPFKTAELLEAIHSKIEKRKKILSFAVVNEQNRISGELHDSIQQLLVASQMGFKSIKEEIGTLDHDTQDIFERSLDFLKEATTEVRNLSHGIGKEKEIDLKAKIENLFNQLEDAGELDTQFIYNVTNEFDNVKKIELLRIIQEAVTNVMKYAHAEKISLLIESTNSGSKIEIKDDGVGFDILNVKEGHGISNMTKRAETIGFSFDIETNSKKGTTISLVS